MRRPTADPPDAQDARSPPWGHPSISGWWGPRLASLREATGVLSTVQRPGHTPLEEPHGGGYVSGGHTELGAACTHRSHLPCPSPPWQVAELTKGRPAAGGRTGRHWLAWLGPPCTNAGFRSGGRRPTRGIPVPAPLLRGSPPPPPGAAGSSPLTSCFSGRSLRSCFSTSTSNLPVSPARIIAMTSSLGLQVDRTGRRGQGRTLPQRWGLPLGPRQTPLLGTPGAPHTPMGR